MKRVQKIFSGFFNEKDESIEISSKIVMVEILQLFLGGVLKGLNELGEQGKVVRLVSLKSISKFVGDLENEELIVLTFKGLQESVEVFQEFPKIQKSFVKQLGSIWLENDSFKARFYSFILLREIVKKGDANLRLETLKRICKGYFKGHSDFSWRTLETQRF
jgi:hypothetical protein